MHITLKKSVHYNRDMYVSVLSESFCLLSQVVQYIDTCACRTACVCWCPGTWTVPALSTSSSPSNSSPKVHLTPIILYDTEDLLPKLSFHKKQKTSSHGLNILAGV